MVLRPGRGGSISLEMVDLFARYGFTDGKQGLIDEPAHRTAFDRRIAAGLDDALSNPSRLHGWRVQTLFEAMVIALGTVRLIKQEDIGTYFFDDVDGWIQPPDFRIVTAAGEQLLVEVKGVAPHDRWKPRKLRGKDVAQLRRYAEMTGARLLFAHYWSHLNQWSLVDADKLTVDGANYTLSFEDAMRVNEMSAVGDAWIGTVPPLTWTLIAAPESVTSTIVDDGAQQIDFQIAGVELGAAGRVLENPIELRIAQFLVLYGNWEEDCTPITDDNGRVTRLVFSYAPPEPAEPADPPTFEIVGQLSAMYSTLFNAETLKPDNSVSALHHEPDPGMLRDLVPTDYWDRTKPSLQIWKLHLDPDKGENGS
ncbi:hypothetical protein OHB26_39400 (plasmid) [Nocardia sp. NBC_01503]|uniref:hypothetical protein n=1 Tax=Nocardia sp. NBC_01503 TaxID=2975997 RepID=UPI002E7BDFD6|nr:hypothetical protein [Nocardia sp. NBC_01503]WTL36702.1 hypothetical protein OHB26_39175 [Nocardia sp. NBC_01503]WTL36745.1 hypothetical protein OHB26_39400 [Nocardia sp. NBC_01503]